MIAIRLSTVDDDEAQTAVDGTDAAAAADADARLPYISHSAQVLRDHQFA